MMKNWGFANGDGNELTRGWQGTDDQARAQCQRFADMHQTTVECWDESDVSEDGEPVDSLITCEPGLHVGATATFAAIGSDGLKEVVWGVGPTAAAAERDARAEADGCDPPCDPEITRTVQITLEQEQLIRGGHIDAADLGI